MDPVVWAVTGALGALLLRLGYAVHATGMARAKNAASAIARQLVDLCVATLAFWAVGLAIVASGARVFGIDWRLLLGWHLGGSAGVALPFLAMVLVATGIVPGVQTERARFWPSLGSSLLLGALVVPVAILWTAGGGWLRRWGLIDAAGAAPLHWAGALCAAVGALAVGPRTGKFHRDGSSTAIPGHSVPLAGVGVLLQIAGFFAFAAAATGGDRAGLAAFNTLLAVAAGGLTSVVLCQLRYYKPDVHLTCAGMLGAAVAISAGAPAVAPPAAALIGAVAGFLVPFAILMFDVRLRLDDPSGGVAIHGVGAAWGLIATPLLARSLDFADRFTTLGVHLLALIAIGLLAGGLSCGLWAILKRVTPIRAREQDEFDGLDLAEHDIGSYPDFQQTMIKSYHLREV